MDNMLFPGIVSDSSSFIRSSLQEMRDWVMEGLPADRTEWEANLRRRYVVNRQPDAPVRSQPQQAAASSTPAAPQPIATAPPQRAEAMDVGVDEDAVVPSRVVNETEQTVPVARAEAPRASPASGGVRRPMAGATGGIPPAVDNWEEVLPRVRTTRCY